MFEKVESRLFAYEGARCLDGGEVINGGRAGMLVGEEVGGGEEVEL
jgi:hypothetical protein